MAALDWIDWPTPFVFFTGKGGVGKTTVASAAAVGLADSGRSVLLVSTDPASNLLEVLGCDVGAVRGGVPDVPGLEVMNLDPDAAAAAYRERVIAPYRGVVSEDELRGIEEQLAGECTVEVAAFDQFTQLIVHPELTGRYDRVLFDTAPTGHTLRLLSLPSAWSQYIEQSPDAASCLGPRSGLEVQRAQYRSAVEQLGDAERTTLVLVSRPDAAALQEAARAGEELSAQGIRNQRLVINGLFDAPLRGDVVAEALADRQREALDAMPATLDRLAMSTVPMVGVDLIGVPALRALISSETRGLAPASDDLEGVPLPSLAMLVDALAAEEPGAVLVMGKGGVGKTTIAAAAAVGLAGRGFDVHLSTTDPAGRPDRVLGAEAIDRLSVSRIDPAAELARYTEERLAAAQDLSPDRLALLQEDLRSPCTAELAVFRAFARLLSEAKQQFVVLDTAPSGHTLRLLDLTGSYHRQVMRGAPAAAARITTPLMRLQDPAFSRILVVTLAETTPVSEAAALQEDLRRAGIEPFGWVLNGALTGTGTRDALLRARAALERPQLRRVRDGLAARAWMLPWQVTAPTGAARLAALVKPGDALRDERT